MPKFVGVRVHCAYNIGIVNHGEEETLGTEPKTPLSIDRYFDPAENVNVLISNLVML